MTSVVSGSIFSLHLSTIVDFLTRALEFVNAR
jgi:hypothetical protein